MEYFNPWHFGRFSAPGQNSVCATLGRAREGWATLHSELIARPCGDLERSRLDFDIFRLWVPTRDRKWSLLKCKPGPSTRYDQRLDGLRQCISLISVGSKPPYDALQLPIVRAFAGRGRRCLARFGLDVACSSLVHLAFKLSNNLEGRYASIR